MDPSKKQKSKTSHNKKDKWRKYEVHYLQELKSFYPFIYSMNIYSSAMSSCRDSTAESVRGWRHSIELCPHAEYRGKYH